MNTPLQKPLRILLIGDSCIDEYQYGTVDRISPEAPVPIFKYLRSDEKPGMVYNVRNNLEKLGCEVTLLTREPSRKIRLIDGRTGHHIARVDHDVLTVPIDVLPNATLNYDAIVISDYNKGVVTYELVEELIKIGNCPVYIDTKKKDLARFEGAFIKINSLENSAATSYPTELIVTLGKHGARYKDKIYSAPSIEVSDVCGAGDTFLSALVYFHLTTCNMELAIPLANKASAVTVQKVGTYAPTMEEFL
jgi:D-beta-D-heptose 7-phosphate kinase/D-beta-D-heptose 1-phosphate adenosyltransferase